MPGSTGVNVFVEPQIRRAEPEYCARVASLIGEFGNERSWRLQNEVGAATRVDDRDEEKPATSVPK